MPSGEEFFQIKNQRCQVGGAGSRKGTLVMLDASDFPDFSTQSERGEAVLVQCAISGRDDFELSVFADVAIIKRMPRLSQPRKVVYKQFTALDREHSSFHTHMGNFYRRPTPVKRGRVLTFSRRSRKRMLEKLAKLRDASGGYFVTLTYPGRFDWTPSDCKRHLANFRREFERRFPGSGAFWRLEIKPRLSGESVGVLVPHFHLLIFGVNPPSLPYLRRWIKVTWSRIAAYPDSEPMLLRTQCDEITSRRHAAAYASKYAAKEVDGTLVLFQSENSDTWGRHWGTFGTLDLAEVAKMTLSGDALVQFKRLVRGWLKSKGSGYAKRLSRFSPDVGFSAFGLGDLSGSGNGDVFGVTVMRMAFAAIRE